MNDEFERDQLPPHDEKAEIGLVSCMILAGVEGSQAQVDAILEGTRPGLFYCHFEKSVYEVIRSMRAKGNAIDPITLGHELRAKEFHPDSIRQILAWIDEVPSALNWTYYRDILAELLKRRKILKLAADASAMARDQTLDPSGLQEDIASILEGVAAENSLDVPRLTIRKASERRDYVPPAGIDLVGECEIFKGAEGLAVLAGPGGSGKSLMLAGLVLGGAIGHGTWMGRKIHRKFKSLVVQDEVGPRRLSKTMKEFERLHPEADVENQVFYSDPPPYGYAINDKEFWRELSKQVKLIKPDLLVIDPISGLSVIDDASEVVNAIRTIRIAAGTGDDAPCILLVAHTKKPRSEESIRGRNLSHMVSGSVQWVNKSRVSYLCLPWDSEELEDDRIYFATAKINDGPMYAPTVWKRRFGTFFEHDPNTNPKDWGKPKTDEERNEDRRKIGREDLEAAFGDRPGMKRAELVRALVAAGHDEATCYRATKPDGYLMKHLHVVAGIYGFK